MSASVLVFTVVLVVGQGSLSEAAPMGTAFTYQGRLIDANSAADGLYDFQFKLYDDANTTTGNQVGSTIDINELDVIDGYFTVELDFGGSVFDGNAVWLEIGVRPGELEDPNDYTTLSPRQGVTPTPYAIYAKTAGHGHSLDAADGSPVDVLYVDNAGKVGIGTTTPSYQLEVKAPSNSALQLSTQSPNSHVDIRGIPTGGGNLRLNVAGGANVISFNVNNKEKVRMDSNGKVGIGTTSPRGKLDVEGDGSNIYLDTWTAQIYIGDIDGDGDETLFTVDDNAGKFTFENGDVGIGITNPDEKLTVDGTIKSTTSATDGRGVYAEATGSNGVGGYFVAHGTFGWGIYGVATGSDGKGVQGWGYAYDFYAAGSGINYGSSSSIRWKSDVRPIDDPLGKVMNLRGVYFNWDEEHGGEHDVGMIAEEVGKVLPEIVQYEEDGIYTSGMDYSKLTPLLVEAVKELKGENDRLKERVEALERTIHQLAKAKEFDLRGLIRAF